VSNWFMTWLLRSPFHGLISGSILLITYNGRRSGTQYSAPLNYFRDGNTLWVTSVRDRRWWRNFRGEWPIRVLLQRVEIEHDWMQDASEKYIEAFATFVMEMSRYIEREAHIYGFDYIEMSNRQFDDAVCQVVDSLLKR